jgi:hypothetical protein
MVTEVSKDLIQRTVVLNRLILKIGANMGESLPIYTAVRISRDLKLQLEFYFNRFFFSGFVTYNQIQDRLLTSLYDVVAVIPAVKVGGCQGQ